MIISTYLLIITLNVNELNAPIRGHRMTKWIKKRCCTLKRVTVNHDSSSLGELVLDTIVIFFFLEKTKQFIQGMKSGPSMS